MQIVVLRTRSKIGAATNRELTGYEGFFDACRY